jgi:ubiquinol-cytochrome c reductase cytochrome c1 subunit
MKTKILPLLTILALAPAFVAMNASQSSAAGGAVELEHQDWHFDGFTGTFDRAALQRGLKVYREVCSACHSMKRIAFRNLADLGYNEAQIKNIAAEYIVTDGPDEDGEMFERPARPSDYFPSPFANDNAARAANGAIPPDLSLIVKARPHGADYLYGLLTGYEDAPADANLADGQYWNKVMPGHVIAMANPLSDDQVAYEDGTPTTVEQYSKDLTEFLAWAAEPEMEERKALGFNVLIFLIVFTGLMYAVKKKIWADVH